MDIPNSPVEFMQRCLIEQLDSLPEDSTVELSVNALRELYVHYMDAIDLINEQQELINAFVENG